MNPKIEILTKMVEEQQLERLNHDYPNFKRNEQSAKTRIIDGNKYIKIDVGTSGKLMIEKATERIYGIKAYGVIHKGHYYGTLDTIEQYYWGEYLPQLK